MPLSYCGALVKRHDPDRFLLSLFAPAASRESLFALYAFNYEIAKTRETVTETQLGLIRLQWWRDALAAVYENGTVPKHQVLTPLAEAIKKYDLPREEIEHLIYAREFDLEDRLPANLAGMKSYADFTNTPLLSLSLKIIGGSDQHIQDAATAFGLVGLLRAVPYHARQRRCYLPDDLLMKEGMTLNNLYEGKQIEKLRPVIEAICAEVRALLATNPDSPYTRRHVKLSRLYLRQIEKAGYDVFSPTLKIPPVFKELRLLWG